MISRRVKVCSRRSTNGQEKVSPWLEMNPPPFSASALRNIWLSSFPSSMMTRTPAISEKTARRLVILVLLCRIQAFQATLPIDDADIWWHLRTCQWILNHGQVPATDPFSAFGLGKPWIAYSWLFEGSRLWLVHKVESERRPYAYSCDDLA